MSEFEPETAIERAIVADPEWQAGVSWGKPRPGHPEGTVRAHIAEVLANVERFNGGPEQRARLRLIALIHDTFKFKVDRARPRIGANEHGRLAAAFASRYTRDHGVLKVIERHDDAYRAWRSSTNEARAAQLIADLEQDLDLFIAFYRCDTYTGDKTDADLHWFTALVERVRTGV
jgi:hypothetical protein